MPLKLRELPSTELLWDEFAYYPLTGELRRKNSTIRRPQYLAPNGYCRLTVRGLSYNRSRLVWKWVHGANPEHLLDHIDRIRDNDQAWNLREVDEAGNMLNRSAYGSKGVLKVEDRWVVLRQVNGQTYRASFNTESEAHYYAADLDSRMNEYRRELPHGRQIPIDEGV